MSEKFDYNSAIEAKLTMLAIRDKEALDQLSEASGHEQTLHAWFRIQKAERLQGKASKVQLPSVLESIPIRLTLARDYSTTELLILGAQSWTQSEDLWNQRTRLTDTSALDSIDGYWKFAEKERESVRAVGRHVTIVWGNFSPQFLPQNADYNSELWRVAVSEQDGEHYDLSPGARFRKIRDEGLYYINHYSYHAAVCALEAAMKLDKLHEAAECIFRLKHILGSGEAPKDLLEAQKIKEISPGIYFFDHWLRLRLADDPAVRRTEAEGAIYWLLEDLLRNATSAQGISRPFHYLCAIIAEAELWDDQADKTEFMKYLKLHAMNGGIGLCKRLMKDKTPLVTPKEMGFPHTDECRKMYAEIAAEEEKKPAKKKSPRKK